MAKSRKRTIKRKVVSKEEPEVHREVHDTDNPRILHATGVPMVYVEKGITKNMGDFNSARVTVGISLPIDYTDAELLKAKKTISVIDKIVVSRLEKEMEDLFED